MKDINDLTPEERTQAWEDALNNFKTATDAIQRVRDIHAPDEYNMCPQCLDFETRYTITYPCPTIRTLDGEQE